LHGVPSDLARHLDQFLGASLNEIGLGMWIIHFRFSTADNVGSPVIGVEGEWELQRRATPTEAREVRFRTTSGVLQALASPAPETLRN
jgi:hypothetical protein